jgi:hypothetical protein
MMVRKSPAAARMRRSPSPPPDIASATDTAALAALVARLAGDRRDVPAVLGCLAACGLAGPRTGGTAALAPGMQALAAAQGPQRALREQLRRSVPLVGAIARVLVHQPQFCLPVDWLVDILRQRPDSAGDIERHTRAVIAWGACAGLFFHDAAGDVVHLGLFDF